ncbi:MAG: zf-HC2 domain-containing protein [Terracidiphilus sp.]
MSTTPQHEVHPDAELLSAVAEQALCDGERSQVLAHLVVCGRCRQVLSVAQQSAEVEVEEPVAAAALAAAAAPVVAVRKSPSAWWRKWRLVWVPAAVAAALAVTTFSVYLRQSVRNDSAIKVAEETPAPKLASPSAPSPTEPTQTASPAPPTRNRPVARSVPSAPRQDIPAAPLPAAAPPPPLPPPPATETVEVAQDSAAPETVSSQQVARIEPRPLAEAKVLQSTGAASNAPLDKKQSQAQLNGFAASNQETEAKTSMDKLFTEGGLPAQAPQGQKPLAASGAETSAAVYRQQAEMRAGTVAAFGSLHGVSGTSTASGKPIHLPSGLAVASLVSANHLLLAVDKAGTLFLSSDAGTTWQHVVSQWTGRAILVRRRPLPAQPVVAATSVETPGHANGAPQSSPTPVTIFEIVNDQNQVWLSTDGNTWTAR